MAEKNMPVKEYLDVEGAAEVLDVGEATARNLMNQFHESCGKNGIPNVRVGEKLLRTTREDIRKWYENQKRAHMTAARISG